MRAKSKQPADSVPQPKSKAHWTLKLYVAGQSPRSSAAFDNLTRICEEEMKGRYTIEVVDLLKNPRLAGEDQILAIPTVVRKLPSPVRRIIGDLSDVDRVLIGLDLRRATRRGAVT